MKNSNVVDDLGDALKASKRGFIAAGCFSFFINILMLTAPMYMLQVYDRVVAARSLETLLFLTIMMVFLFAVLGVLQWVRSLILVRVSNQLDQHLSQRVYSAMFKAGVKVPNQRTSQPLNDLTSIRQFMTGNGLFAFFDAPWLPIYVGLLFLFNPAFGWFAIGASLVLLCIAVLNEKLTKKMLTEANGENIKAQNLASSNLRNAEVLHAMGMLPDIMKRWSKQHKVFLNKQTVASDRAGIFSNMSKVLRMIFQSAILGLGAYYVVQNEMSPGMMIAGSILLGRALAPLDLLINSWSGFNNARSARTRLQELLTSFPEEDRSMSLPEPTGRVEAINLFVGPPGSRTPTLKGANFVVNPGELVGIIGPSAAGKSSLAKAILGVWPTLNGTLRIDDAEVQHYNRDEIGPHIGYLPQDIELFNGTVSENIARFGELNPELVVAAAKKAGVHEMILQLPDAYDTRIGVDSGALSGGQRQRVGLARALYGAPKVVVLDEPNSNLDEQGEKALSDTMQILKQEGISTFVISHRTSILKSIDKLMVLKEGQMQMFGPKEEVMQKLMAQKAADKTALKA
ncbi:Type I secretion system ATP-binding protein PrsD [Marinomonas gallaica]|uniref:Type I secretion system ATP-binding protein PrsD n=1 Tax=Marinomonas gallaica TaxID=1806667 RepID=A0A1C3JVZ5_9GAMM|nr:type I secretion system permease/ATPase [Marinomonas gallaica]SBT19292.1 Type I secretion system ATP-binding protein PrsD [Marinomonas gallaica]SBT22699.1 Type I secretion system ATP-binding protein PrsD [Marinomonas gallaica]